MHDIDLSSNPAFLLEQQALHRKHERVAQIDALKSSPKSKELSKLIKILTTTHDGLCIYDKMSTPPTFADHLQSSYSEVLARSVEITTPTPEPSE